MPCSPEKLAANRRNSLKSCGPRTADGKANSRRNGLKHGLTGAGVVLPDEDQSAIDERFEAFKVDLKPKTAVATAMVLRAAMLSVRMERCVRQEAAKITRDMLLAERTEADERAEEIDRLADSLRENPHESVRKLRRSAEGIDWLIRSWQALKAPLADGAFDDWTISHANHAERLTGKIRVAFEVSRISVLTSTLREEARAAGVADEAEASQADRRQAARVSLIALIDAELAGLGRDRTQLKVGALAAEREGAAVRAIFDASPEAALARRYEAAAERGFYKAIEEVEFLNAATTVDTNRDEDNNSDELASSCTDEDMTDELFDSRYGDEDDLTPSINAGAEDWASAREQLREELRVLMAGDRSSPGQA